MNHRSGAAHPPRASGWEPGARRLTGSNRVVDFGLRVSVIVALMFSGSLELCKSGIASVMGWVARPSRVVVV
jgi:hypothetical protein